MKLATEKDGSRDGRLLVVNQQLTQAVSVENIAKTLQQALDDWANKRELLQQVYEQLSAGLLKNVMSFDPKKMHSPLPRAYQWADGSAYVNHVELVRKSRGATLPENFWTDPLMYQGGSDNFIGPCDNIVVADENYGIDLEAEVAVITDDVPMGISAENAAQHIQLILLVNDVSLRRLIPDELAKGFGFFHGKPASSFSPVAITPDELGNAWDGRKVHLPIVSHINDQLLGQPNAGVDMTFDFPALIAHAAKTRNLSAGTIIGSGTVSNADRTTGSSCLAEKRILETLTYGKAKTEFLHFGDRVRIEMFASTGESIFGAIDQEVVRS